MLFFKPSVEKLKEKKDVAGLIKALRHNDVSIRRKAARALGDLKAKDAVDALVEALSDEDVDVRIEVVRALKKIRDPKMIDALLEVVRKDESLDVKIEAAKALKDIGYSKATELIINLVSQSLKVPKEIAEKIVSEGKIVEAILDKKRFLDRFLKKF